MNRSQLEHVIRAAAAIAGDAEIVVIGSALRHRLVDPSILLERLALTPVDTPNRQRIAQQVEADSKA